MTGRSKDIGELDQFKSAVRKIPSVNCATSKSEIAYLDSTKSFKTATSKNSKPDGIVPSTSSKSMDTGRNSQPGDNDQARGSDGAGKVRRSQSANAERKEPVDKRTKMESGGSSSREQRYAAVVKPHSIPKKTAVRVLSSPPPKGPRAAFVARSWETNKRLYSQQQQQQQQHQPKTGTYLSLWKRAKDKKVSRSETTTADDEVDCTGEEALASDSGQKPPPCVDVASGLGPGPRDDAAAPCCDRSSTDALFTERGIRPVRLTEMELQTCLRLNSLARNIGRPPSRRDCCGETLRCYGTGSDGRAGPVTADSGGKRTAIYDGVGSRTRSIPAKKPDHQQQRPVAAGNRSASEFPIRKQRVADGRSGDGGSPAFPGSIVVVEQRPCGLRRSPVSDALCTEKRRAAQLVGSVDCSRASKKNHGRTGNVGYFEFAHSSCSTADTAATAVGRQKGPNRATRAAFDTSAPPSVFPSRERNALGEAASEVPRAIPRLSLRYGVHQRNRKCSGRGKGGDRRQRDADVAVIGRRERGRGGSEESTKVVRSSTVVLNRRCNAGRHVSESDDDDDDDVEKNPTEIVHRYSPPRSPGRVDAKSPSAECDSAAAAASVSVSATQFYDRVSVALSRSFRNRELSLRNPSPTKSSELRRMVQRSKDGSWSAYLTEFTQGVNDDDTTAADVYDDHRRVGGSPLKTGLLRLRCGCTSVDSESPSPQRTRTRTLNSSETDDPARLSPTRSARIRNIYAFPSFARTFLVETPTKQRKESNSDDHQHHQHHHSRPSNAISTANRSFCSRTPQSSPTKSVSSGRRTFLEGERCFTPDGPSRRRWRRRRRGETKVGVARAKSSLECLPLRSMNTSDSSEEQRPTVDQHPPPPKSEPSTSPVPDRSPRPDKSLSKRLSPCVRPFKAHAVGRNSPPPLRNDRRFCSTPLQGLARGPTRSPLFLSPIPKSVAGKELNVNSSNTSRIIRSVNRLPLRTQIGGRSPEIRSPTIVVRSSPSLTPPPPSSSKAHRASSLRPPRPVLSRRTTWKISYDADVSNASLEGELSKRRNVRRRLPVCRKFKNWSRAVSVKLSNGRITRIPVASWHPFLFLPPEAATFRVRLLSDIPARSFRFSKLHRKAVEVLFPVAIRQLPSKLLSRVIS